MNLNYTYKYRKVFHHFHFFTHCDKDRVSPEHKKYGGFMTGKKLAECLAAWPGAD